MFGLDPAADNARTAADQLRADDRAFCAASAINGCGIALKDHPIILAVSGGPDSMAMALHMQAWHCAQSTMPMRAIIVNHGIRPEAEDEARLVAARLTALGINAEIMAVTTPAPSTGVQAWARAERYRLLAHAARGGDRPAAVITGHHALDQAETIAMRLAAGSGLVGLRGMQKVAHHEDMMLLRPFLDVNPVSLRQILKDRTITAVDDPSNHMEHFERIAVRQQMNAWADDGITPMQLQRLGHLSAGLIAVLNGAIAEATDGHMGRSLGGALWMHVDVLRHLPDTALVHFIRHIVADAGQAPWPVAEKAAQLLLDKLYARIDAGDGIAGTLGGLEWHIRHGVLWVYPEAEHVPKHMAVAEGRGFYNGRWCISTPFAGKIEALGGMRAAALRRLAPDYTDALRRPLGHVDMPNAPMRSLWRLPVLRPLAKKLTHDANLMTGEGWLALEDGAIIPHVVRNDIYFTRGGDGFTICDHRPQDLI